MDDLISRQAVLKIIDGWYEQNRDTDNIEDLIVLITYMDSVTPQKPICPSAGIDCEDCPAYEKKTGWIPVSERLPEEHEWIGTKRFGTTKSDEVYVTFETPKGERFTKHLSFQNGKLSIADQQTINVFYKGSVPVAWMPLPEPYKAEGSDKE